MPSIRDQIAHHRAEIERLEPLAVEEERRQATRQALVDERRGAEWRRSLGQMTGTEPMGQPLSPLANTTGIEHAAEAASTIELIDKELASLDAA